MNAPTPEKRPLAASPQNGAPGTPRLDPSRLSPTSKAINAIAHYFAENNLAGDPLAGAVGALYAIEASGLVVSEVDQ